MHATQFDRANDEPTGPIFEIERTGMLAADQIIVASNYTKKIIADRYGQDPQKIEVGANAVPKTSCEPRKKCVPTTPLIAFIGRIDGQTGAEYVVEAAYKIFQEIPAARLVPAANGDLPPIIKSLVKWMDMAARFHFPGFWSAADVRLLRDCAGAAQPAGDARAELRHFGLDRAARQVHGIYAELPSVSPTLA